MAMEFRIADTFTDSLGRLTGDEQKLVKTTAFDLQLNPASPGMSFHKLDHARDKNFWSVRVGGDIRLIVHRSESSLLLCALQSRLNRLLTHEPRLAERIDVYSLEAIGLRLHKTQVGTIKLASRDDIRQLVDEAAKDVHGHKFSRHFLLTEWEQVVDAWQLDHWEAYRDVLRLGHRTRLPEAQRTVLWAIFERVRSGLREGVSG